ncbi:MAG: F0F1 ATP synthase subunit A [Lachnospiraceae bacterium]
MGGLGESLVGDMGVRTVFTIPMFGGIPVKESVIVTWIIMAGILVASAILVRDLKIENPGKKQLLLEKAVGGIYNFFDDVMGGHGKAYIPYLISIGLYIAFSDLIGIIGLKPPTMDLNVTATLAILSILLIQTAGIRKRGIKGWLKSFTEPMLLILPLNIMELIIKPLSLCMRLFGNILGAYIIMELIKFVVPAVIPAVFSIYFDIFDGLLQAYIFVFLTSLFIGESMGE